MDPLLQQLMALCHALNNIALSFTFVCCPGHVVIEGNEEAVAAARHLTDSPIADAIAI